MKRQRYYTEDLHVNNPVQISSMHHFAREYHWVRLDDETIMGHGEIEDWAFTKLMSPPPDLEDISVAAQAQRNMVLHPSIHDRKPLKVHLNNKNKAKHADVLTARAGMDPNDDTATVVGKLVELGHTFLAPEK